MVIRKFPEFPAQIMVPRDSLIDRILYFWEFKALGVGEFWELMKNLGVGESCHLAPWQERQKF